jgi:hypothetical protein
MSDLEKGWDSDGGSVYVDVGERNLFCLALEDTVQYTEVYRSQSRMVLCALSSAGVKTTIRVSWSGYKRVAQNRGYRGMEICGDMTLVPALFSRDLHRVGSTYIEVSTREYMEGRPLSEVWYDMVESEKLEIAKQVEGFMQDMSAYTSEKFMFLQGRNLSTPDPVEYINYKMLLSMITRDLHRGDCSTIDMNTFPCVPTLCHGNLCMEHIIVRGATVVGIVGWSQCDFVPEVMDRMKYHFSRPRAEGELSWYTHLTGVLLFHPPPPPLYTVVCTQYLYYLRLRSTPSEYHHRLRERLDQAYGALLPPVRQSYMGFDPCVEGSCSDQRSRYLYAEPKPQPEDNPFSCSEYEEESSSETQVGSVSSVSSWSDGDTVLDILDSLSVV